MSGLWYMTGSTTNNGFMITFPFTVSQLNSMFAYILQLCSGVFCSCSAWCYVCSAVCSAAVLRISVCVLQLFCL